MRAGLSEKEQAKEARCPTTALATKPLQKPLVEAVDPLRMRSLRSEGQGVRGAPQTEGAKAAAVGPELFLLLALRQI